MGLDTGISWAHHTFNPWIGCTKVSPGCRNCYAQTLITQRMGRAEAWGKSGTRDKTKTWPQVRTWNRQALQVCERRRVFPSLCDPFECRDSSQMEILDDFFDLIRDCAGLDFLLLTKRPQNILGSLPEDWGPEGWPNLWLGVSVESGEKSCVCGVSGRPVSERIDVLAMVPAVVRFVSYEPALGPFVDIRHTPGPVAMDWVIYGAESGAGRRREGVEGDPKVWARQVRRECSIAGIAFWHKQGSAFKPGQGVELEGEIVQEVPTPRRVSPMFLSGQQDLFAA